MAAKKKKTSPGVLAENRKARFNYSIEEVLECGIELKGTEVKSMKAGKISFPDSFVEIKDGEFWVKNLHITPYDFGNINNHSPERFRRLLAHKQEIAKWTRKVNERGFTIVPLKFYLKEGRVKVEIALCKGKKTYDKRDTIKKRDMDRGAEREFKIR